MKEIQEILASLRAMETPSDPQCLRLLLSGETLRGQFRPREHWMPFGSVYSFVRSLAWADFPIAGYLLSRGHPVRRMVAGVNSSSHHPFHLHYHQRESNFMGYSTVLKEVAPGHAVYGLQLMRVRLPVSHQSCVHVGHSIRK